MIKSIKIKIAGILGLCIFFANTSIAQESEESGLLKQPDQGFDFLFNGRDLSGWHVFTDNKGKDPNLFKAENGMIHAYPGQTPNTLQSFGGIATDKNYDSYILSLEYRWGENKYEPRVNFVRDAGIIFHVHGPEEIWPNGVECQIQEGDTGDIWVIGCQVTSKVEPFTRNYSSEGALATRGSVESRYNRFHRSYMWETPGWNKVVIEVDGDHANYFVNGKLVNEVLQMKYQDGEEWKPLLSGKILLQAEGAEIYYRNIQLKQK